MATAPALGRRFLTQGRRILAAAAILGLGAAACAQPGEGRGGGPGGGRQGMMGGMGGMFEATITSRDMERYAEFLGLNEEQKGMVGLLFEGYSTRTRQIGEDARARMREAREQAGDARGPGAWEGMRESFEKVRADRQEAEESFLADVKALLSEDQAARWPQLERTMRRERTISRGRMSGERADLIRILEEVQPPAEARAQLDPVLERYAIDLDRELIARNEVYDTVMSRVGELFRDGDAEAAQAVIEKARDASTRVRDLNRRYAREIEPLLPEETRAAFDQAFRRASFPQVYRESFTDRSITAVLGFEDLDADQKERVAALQANYRRDAAGLNERLAQETEKSEEQFNIGQMFRRGGGEEGPLGELREQRRQLDRDALDNLRKILRPEQLERLPQREERDEGFRRPQRNQGPPA